MSDKLKLPLKLKKIKQSELKSGDIFLWKSGASERFEIHAFKGDSGYGAETFTEPKGKDGGFLTVSYSGICGVIETIKENKIK